MANLREIQEFLENISKTDLQNIKIKTKDFELSVQLKPETNSKQTQTYTLPTQSVIPQPTIQQISTPIQTEEKKIVENKNEIIVKSPMVGTFYRKPSPDKPNFVEIGQHVKVGDTLCIIEAMKLFNEIESEVEGEIVKIIANDANPVEFDQTLFIIKTN
jgi:acetyl-CoA carboxylase biotin carboxyl carrier protein